MKVEPRYFQIKTKWFGDKYNVSVSRNWKPAYRIEPTYKKQITVLSFNLVSADKNRFWHVQGEGYTECSYIIPESNLIVKISGAIATVVESERALTSINLWEVLNDFILYGEKITFNIDHKQASFLVSSGVFDHLAEEALVSFLYILWCSRWVLLIGHG